MKKISYYLPFLLLFTALTFVSCDDEQLEGEFVSTADDEISVPVVDCEDAELIVSLGRTGFINTNNIAGNATVVEACQILEVALLTAIANCDDTAEFQQLLDTIGDCTESNPCVQAQIAVVQADIARDDATDETEEALCLAYIAALENRTAICNDFGDQAQSVINFLSCSDDTEPTDPECIAAQENTAEALEVFNMADITDEVAYTEACGNYSLALQEQIIACGDEDGSLQAIVNELGDCSIPEDDGPVRMTIDGEFKNFNVAEAPIDGSTFEVTATDIDVNDTFQFTVVLLQTGENVIQNVVLTIDGVAFTPVLSGDPQFANEITQNDGTVIMGTFSGPMMNADGDIITITGGIINIEV